VKYSCEVVIERSRGEVISKFDSSQNLPKWQPTLRSAEPLTGDPGQPGSTMRLVYDQGKRQMEMIETVTANNLPESFDATYTTSGVINPCHNTFEEVGDSQTRWVMETEFNFSGFMAIMSFFMRKAFPKETQRMMGHFKKFVEST